MYRTSTMYSTLWEVHWLCIVGTEWGLMHRFTANLAARLEEALGSAWSYQPWFANFNATFSTNSPLTAPSFLLNKCWIFTQPPNNTKFSLNPLTTRSFHFNPAYKPYFHSSLTNPSSHSTLLNQQMPDFCLTPQIYKCFSQPPIEMPIEQCFFITLIKTLNLDSPRTWTCVGLHILVFLCSQIFTFFDLTPLTCGIQSSL